MGFFYAINLLRAFPKGRAFRYIFLSHVIAKFKKDATTIPNAKEKSIKYFIYYSRTSQEILTLKPHV